MAWAVILCISAASVASAAPVQWTVASGGNGHYYEFVLDHTDWFDARDTAAASTYMGVSGHLVTITSAAENDFVWNHMSIGTTDFRYRGNWIGAYQYDATSDKYDTENGFAAHEHWAWVTGEEFVYSNWFTPDLYPDPTDGRHGSFGTEFDFAKFQSHHSGPSTWSDTKPWKNPSLAHGYMIEYSVPEPATLSLLPLGGLALIRRRRVS